MTTRPNTSAFAHHIRARDGGACRRCRARDRRLHVHHLRSWASTPHMRFDELNVVTLCRDCHLWVHSRANVNREWLS